MARITTISYEFLNEKKNVVTVGFEFVNKKKKVENNLTKKKGDHIKKKTKQKHIYKWEL